MIESENGPAGDEKLTFRYMRGIIPRHDLQEIRGVHDEYGGFSQLALLISDQCPFGITVLLPGGRVERVTGSVLSHTETAKTLVNEFNPKSMVEGSKSPVFRFPRIAITEALTNAVAHRDYSVEGDIVVNVQSDEVRIVSPGPVYRQNWGIRNPELVAVMELFRLKGFYRNGVDVIRKSYARSGFDPKLITCRDCFMVVLPAVESIRGHYNAKVDKVTAYMSKRGGVTFDEIRSLLRVSKPYTASLIKKMEGDGTLFEMRVGRMRRYFLCDKGRRGKV